MQQVQIKVHIHVLQLLEHQKVRRKRAFLETLQEAPHHVALEVKLR